MRKATIVGPRQAAVVDAPEPRARENWAVVRVLAAPLCTEYKGFVAGHRAERLGHEAAGEVVDAGTSSRVQPGDRVVVMPQYPCGRCELCLAGDYIHCQHLVDASAFTGSPEGTATLAQYLVKPDWLLLPLPAEVSWERGSMACCGLGPTFGALERMGVGAFDTVLITGLGPVGLGGVINARYRGARVIGVEANAWRAERARQLGAEAVVAPGPGAAQQVLDLTCGRGVDCALDCAGEVAAHRLCIEATRRRGQVAFVGECSAETPVRVSPDLIRKGLTLIGSWHYNLNGYRRVLQTIQACGSQLDRLISHTFALEEVQQAWELQATGDCAKVVLRPWA